MQRQDRAKSKTCSACRLSPWRGHSASSISLRTFRLRQFAKITFIFLTRSHASRRFALENILALDALRSENLQLKAELNSTGKLIGESRQIRQIEEFISRVAQSDSTVLIRGEKAVRAKRLLHARFIRTVRGMIGRSSPSTALQFPIHCLKVNYSDTRGALLPAR